MRAYNVFYVSVNKVESEMVQANSVITDGHNNLAFYDEDGQVAMFKGGNWIRWERLN